MHRLHHFMLWTQNLTLGIGEKESPDYGDFAGNKTVKSKTTLLGSIKDLCAQMARKGANTEESTALVGAVAVSVHTKQ